MQPSGQPSCQPTGEPSSVPTQHKYLDYTPDILALTHNFDNAKSVLHIKVAVEAPAAIYCGVFDGSDAVSAHAIRSQGHSSFALEFFSEIMISTLAANTVHDIYCMTTTLDGSFDMSLASILDTRYTIFVPCCRNDLSIDISSKYMAESDYLQDAMVVRFELGLPVINEVHVFVEIVPVYFFTLNDTVTSRLLSVKDQPVKAECLKGMVVDPTFISILPSESWTSNDQYVRIGSTCPGAFYVNISAVEVDSMNNQMPLIVSYSNDNLIEIVPVNNSDYEFNAPIILSGQFILDGQEIELRFDSATNMADLGGISFLCNMTVHFVDAESTWCYWKSPTMLRIKQAKYLLPSDNVTLLGGVVASVFSLNAVTASTTMPLGVALTSLPVVKISSPTFVSSCAAFSLDLTLSSGSGGRKWKSVVVRVTTTSSAFKEFTDSVDGNVSTINAFYEKEYKITESTELPAHYLQSEQVYLFQITLCNFLDFCAHKDHILEVGTLPIASVFILGDMYKTSFRTEAVRVKAVPVSDCNGTGLSSLEFKAQYSPVYKWDIFNLYNLSFPVLSITRANKFSSAIALTPYSLNSNNEYKIIVTLVMSFEGDTYTSQYTCYLSVLKGPLKAVMSTAGFVSVRYGEVLMLNASESFDSDLGEARDHSRDSSVEVTWSCTLLDASKFANGCGGLTTVDPFQRTLLVNSTHDGYVNALYRIELLVTSTVTGDKRIDISFVDVFIEPGCCSKLTLPPMDLVNTQEMVLVEGRISTSLNGVAEWSLLGSALALNSIVMAPPVVNIFTFYPITTSISTNLVIAPSTLSPSTSYSFELVFNSLNGNDFRSATVTITTNDIPQPGAFSVSPSKGIELDDVFYFSASSWSDEQIPLHYRFGYNTPLGEEVTLKPKNEDSSFGSVLPCGNPNASFTLECFLVVSDKLGAYALSSRHVTVNASTLNTSELDSLYELLANETESEVEEVIEVVTDVFVPKIVIELNCSAAPDCFSLNREPCTEYEHTCGQCFAGNYLGEEGHSNTFCVNNTVREEGVERCFEDESCEPFRQCVEYMCTRISKSCSSACLMNGECIYVNDTTGSTVSDCYIDEISCSTFCICDDGHNGPDCDIPGEQSAFFRYI